MREKLAAPKFSQTIDKIAEDNRDPNTITQVRCYKLITPLFGGGVEARVNDEVTPISGKAIRGQLRFWWRATRGTGTLEEMKRREDAIWGSTEKPSEISIQTKFEPTQKDKQNQDSAFKVKKNQRGKLQVIASARIAQYAAFPLLPDKNERKRDGWRSEEVWFDIEFTLELRYPRQIRLESGTRILLKPEIEAALWAWTTFGGIGARTRRGFGALQLLNKDGTAVEPPTVGKVAETVRNESRAHLAEGPWNEQIPHLLADSPLAFTKSKDSCISAWQDVIEALQDFRQSPRVLRENRFSGRSDWPEADAIRTMVGTNAEYRKPEHPVGKKFPRAVFGLPIGFKFKDEDVRNRDPPETFLEGREKGLGKEAISRLSSPLILRPIACANGKAVGMGLVMQSPRIPPDGIYLYYKDGRSKVDNKPVGTNLTKDQAKDVFPVAKQLGELGAITDDDEDLVLKAFLSYLAKG